jgi:hypothetical protein
MQLDFLVKKLALVLLESWSWYLGRAKKCWTNLLCKSTLGKFVKPLQGLGKQDLNWEACHFVFQLLDNMRGFQWSLLHPHFQLRQKMFNVCYWVWWQWGLWWVILLVNLNWFGDTWEISKAQLWVCRWGHFSEMSGLREQLSKGSPSWMWVAPSNKSNRIGA